MGSGWSSGLQVRFIMSIDNYHESSNQFDYHFDNVLHDLRTHLSTTHMIRSEKNSNLTCSYSNQHNSITESNSQIFLKKLHLVSVESCYDIIWQI